MCFSHSLTNPISAVLHLWTKQLATCRLIWERDGLNTHSNGTCSDQKFSILTLGSKRSLGPRQDASQPEKIKQSWDCTKCSLGKHLAGTFSQCWVIKRLKVRQDHYRYQNIQAMYRLQRTSSSLAVLKEKTPTHRAKLFAEPQTLLLMSKWRA